MPYHITYVHKLSKEALSAIIDHNDGKPAIDAKSNNKDQFKIISCETAKF